MSESLGAIAVAVDGSDASEAALSEALRLAQERGAALDGIFVLDTGWADFIGNDWQSSRNSRQGFLDYVLEHQKQQAEAARQQFADATEHLADARFRIVSGDPLEALCEWMERPEALMLVVGREVYQVSGRPSVKGLAAKLPKRVRQPVVVV